MRAGCVGGLGSWLVGDARSSGKTRRHTGTADDLRHAQEQDVAPERGLGSRLAQPAPSCASVFAACDGVLDSRSLSRRRAALGHDVAGMILAVATAMAEELKEGDGSD